jgi:hypothetical protein
MGVTSVSSVAFVPIEMKALTSHYAIVVALLHDNVGEYSLSTFMDASGSD